MTKVKFNIKNLQISPIESIDDSGVPTYGTPVKCPGAVSLSLDPSGESTVIYADGNAYATVASGAGYTGTLETYGFPTSILKDVFGYEEDKNKNMIEVQSTNKEFGFQFECDNEDGYTTRFTIYRASATKPNISLNTTEDSPTVNTTSVDLTVSAVATEDGAKKIVKGWAEHDATNFGTYFTAITLPTFATI